MRKIQNYDHKNDSSSSSFPTNVKKKEKLEILKLRKSFILSGGKGGLPILIINKLWFLDSYLLKYTLNLFYSAMGGSSHGTIVKNKTDFHSEKQQQQKTKREREREEEEEDEEKKEKKVLAFAKSMQISPHFRLCIVTTNDQTNKPKVPPDTEYLLRRPLCALRDTNSYLLPSQCSFFIPRTFASFPSYLYPILVRSG